MIEVFKTDISQKKMARTLVKSLSVQYPEYRINIDFSDCDKVLRIESAFVFDAEEIVQFVKCWDVEIEPLC